MNEHAFVESFSDCLAPFRVSYSPLVCLQCEQYLAQKRSEFASKLVDLITGAREGIAAVWDDMRAGETSRRAMFPGYFVPQAQFTPELYEAHEEYLPKARVLSIYLTTD